MKYSEQHFTGERALFGQKGLVIDNCVFDSGESPLKQASDIEIRQCLFGWKYPLWYCRNVKVYESSWLAMARAGVWYTENIEIEKALLQAPKNFRRCRNISITDTAMTDAAETLWSCSGVRLKHVSAKGDYFAMNSENIEVDDLKLDGNYSFDGAKNVVVRSSCLLTKDAFWNSENVTVKDSFVSGEYLGWNSKNLTLENCTIESLQGMCYIDGLTLRNCRLMNTTLAFEYSKVEADVRSGIGSVFNPAAGTITAEYIGELIIEKSEVDPGATVIHCSDIRRRSDAPEWKR
ncbi:MAG: DUF3737 family protein [Lachnospiraceae bacterium]|nr:DUF3737 family protein [Lachnospiraceae bacterium]